MSELKWLFFLTALSQDCISSDPTITAPVHRPSESCDFAAFETPLRQLLHEGLPTAGWHYLSKIQAFHRPLVTDADKAMSDELD